MWVECKQSSRLPVCCKASHGENIQEKNISSIYITMGIADTNSELCFHKFLKFNLNLVVGISTFAFFKKKTICLICLLSGLNLPEMMLTTTSLSKSLVRNCQKGIAPWELVKSLVLWTKQIFILFGRPNLDSQPSPLPPPPLEKLIFPSTPFACWGFKFIASLFAISILD